VDGHGDLLADDIFCVPDGPLLLDCLEFDDHLRYVDGSTMLRFWRWTWSSSDAKISPTTSSTPIANCRRRCAGLAEALLYRISSVVRAKVDCVRFTQGNPKHRRTPHVTSRWRSNTSTLGPFGLP